MTRLWLAALLALSAAIPAGATFRILAPGGGGVAAPVFPPVSDNWSRSFDAVGDWFRTPEGRSIVVSVDPHLIYLAGIHSDARRTAASPLATRLDPRLAPVLQAIAAKTKDEQRAAVQALAAARAEVAPAAEAAAVAAWEQSKGEAETADMGAFRALTEQLKGASIYGDAARAAYRASKTAFIERAMRSARRAAKDLAPIDWDSGDFGGAEEEAAVAAAPAPELARLLAVNALPPPSFYHAGHWRPAIVPDRRYARLLDKGAEFLGDEDRADSPEKMRVFHARARLLDTIRAKDPSIYAHLMRVGVMAGMIAWRMGYSMDFAQRAAWGARAHDIGKQEDDILAVVNKPGKLTPEERKIMERHTVAGAELIQQDDELDPLSRRVGKRAAIAHHETLDGKGYPYGLTQGKIPMEARITAVADFFDALLENRPYRAGMTIEKALSIMEKQKDKFDPFVWNAFMSLVAPPAPAGSTAPSPAS
ncbi:MAG: HD domain-containing protein [Elusimicrobia bacterium]|nr:HD domain-containing protein [Elusimicrobiota bacterium]